MEILRMRFWVAVMDLCDWISAKSCRARSYALGKASGVPDFECADGAGKAAREAES